MIDKIKNSPMLTEPWEHKVVDDFLPDSAYLKIREAAKFLTKYTIDGKTNPIWINEALTLGVSKDTVEEIINVTDEILDNINEIVKDFTTVNKSLQGYYAIPKFGISGKDFVYPIHTESSHKILLIVIYLEPDVEKGTRLYNGPKEKDFVKEIEWKPNRAFIVCPNGKNDTTWHTWKNNHGESRVTLNIFCEKIENMQNSLTKSAAGDNPEAILWLYDQIGKNRLTTNKYK
jgi:hypothetical protein